MQDILKKYKQHKLFSNLGIIVTSLIMAIGINFFVIDSTNIGQNIKTSVLNANINNKLADIYLKESNNNILLKTSKNINNVKSISFNISYNPDKLIVKKIIPTNKAQILNLSNTPGINSITLIFNKEINIKEMSTITIIETKKIKNKIIPKGSIIGLENINIFNASFTDNTAETSLLTTSGISF